MSSVLCSRGFRRQVSALQARSGRHCGLEIGNRRGRVLRGRVLLADVLRGGRGRMRS